jgi:hypothetical protein
MRWFAIAILLIAATASTFAQSGGGSITGSIFDRLGRKIASAPVEVTNTDTGAKYATQTDGMGEYTLSLPRGTYTLVIEIAGRRYTQQTVIIIPEHPLRHDVTFPLP